MLQGSRDATRKDRKPAPAGARRTRNTPPRREVRAHRAAVAQDFPAFAAFGGSPKYIRYSNKKSLHYSLHLL